MNKLTPSRHPADTDVNSTDMTPALNGAGMEAIKPSLGNPLSLGNPTPSAQPCPDNPLSLYNPASLAQQRDLLLGVLQSIVYEVMDYPPMRRYIAAAQAAIQTCHADRVRNGSLTQLGGAQ